jgi:hypothetical protein
MDRAGIVDAIETGEAGRGRMHRGLRDERASIESRNATREPGLQPGLGAGPGCSIGEGAAGCEPDGGPLIGASGRRGSSSAVVRAA